MPLVLDRKKLEGISVDGPAIIHIHSIRGTRVKLSVTAPSSTKVLRLELETKDDSPA